MGSDGWTALYPEERARFQAMKEGWAEPPARPGQGARKKGEVRISSGYAANGARLTDIVARDFQVCFSVMCFLYRYFININKQAFTHGILSYS